MKKKTHIFCVIVVLFLTGCSAKNSQVKKETKVEVQVRQAAAQTNAGFNCSPLTLECRKLSLPEVCHYLEMDEEKVTAHLDAMGIHGYFSLIAKNFPPGNEFNLYHIDYKGQINSTKTFFVCPDGSLVTPLNETCVNLADNFLVFAKYLPGEPIDFVLGSKCGVYYAAVRIVPNPIEIVTDECQKLSVQLASKDGKRYQVVGEGFMPLGNYMLISNFENEKLAYNLAANADGKISMAVGSSVPWLTGGNASISLQGDGISRAIYLDFRWYVIPDDEACK